MFFLVLCRINKVAINYAELCAMALSLASRNLMALTFSIFYYVAM